MGKSLVKRCTIREDINKLETKIQTKIQTKMKTEFEKLKQHYDYLHQNYVHLPQNYYSLRDENVELKNKLDIIKLERNKKVTTSPDLQAEIIREANTSRGHFRSSLLSPELKAAAKELKDDDAIVIRRVDKSSIFVILDKEDYMNKLMNILGDTTKFKQITKNPTNDLKTRLNLLIRCNNNTASSPKISLIDGDYKLGYAYGNVKTHKQGFPLRPIISQIPSVTYKLAKRLSELITPYISASCSLKSSEEFLDILRSTPPSGIIGSMDVLSLFTHVPVDETIDMIYSRIYYDREAGDTPLAIPEDTLRCPLRACTKEAPFYGPDERRIFLHHPELLPPVYVRYIDDVFISAENENSNLQIVSTFKRHSSLDFTHELEAN
ncbi:uncharacterized protein LOC143037323 [Oratosquilla oratoria]|uniref:uncharacterized protein LOC143037323 n=1 Tax=Oratosquilla oratoria TaxID=337810 RepID=UPI003F7759D5